MNDVLPKPFTKEGLGAMLDKHLGHLKKNPPPHLATGAATALAHHSSRQSVKEEDSPIASPAHLNANWQSPGHLAGVSPAASNMSDEYMQAIRGHSTAFGMNEGMHAQAGIQYTSTPSHRRHISDITGGDDPASNGKRQQMFPPQMSMHGRSQ